MRHSDFSEKHRVPRNKGEEEDKSEVAGDEKIYSIARSRCIVSVIRSVFQNTKKETSINYINLKSNSYRHVKLMIASLKLSKMTPKIIMVFCQIAF